MQTFYKYELAIDFLHIYSIKRFTWRFEGEGEEILDLQKKFSTHFEVFNNFLNILNNRATPKFSFPGCGTPMVFAGWSHHLTIPRQGMGIADS